MASLNFDDDGQLGSMELYSLQLQKIVADFDDFDAVTKAYVDSKVSQAKQELTDGASEALNTFKELEDYLKDSGTAGGLVEQISALSTQIATEASRAGTEEGKLDARVTSLENDTTSANGISGVQSELDATQQGAGLDLDGSYVADSARNYISGATSLKSADALLDSAVKAEVDRASVAEQGLASSLATAANERQSIDTAYKIADEFIRDRLVVLEADPTTQTQVNIVGNLLNELSANVTSGSAAILGDISVERAARIDGDNNLSTRIATLEADPTTATSVSAVATSVSTLDASTTASFAAATAARATITSSVSAEATSRATAITELENSVNADFETMQESLDTVRTDFETADTEQKTAILGNRVTEWAGDGTLKYDTDGVYYPPQADGSLADHTNMIASQVKKHNDLIGDTNSADTELYFGLASEHPVYLREQQEQKLTMADDVTTALKNVATHAKAADDTLTGRIADQESKQATDDSKMATALADQKTDLEGLVGDERVRAENAEALLNSGIATNTSNLAAQVSKQAGDLATAESRHSSSEAKHTSSDERHAGHDTKHAAHEENLGELETQKFDKAGGEITGEVRVNLDASYFYLSSVWRIRTDAIGKRIVFEFNKDVTAYEGEGDWVSGIPFISSH
jgi:hypothetical protein